MLLRLRRPWRDGTRAIRFEPSELLEKLAAMVPRPRANLLLYHGAFAARGCWRVAQATAPRPGARRGPARRPRAVGARRPAVSGRRARPPSRARRRAAGYVRPRHVAWAELLRRTFGLDVLACPDCGGRLRLVATIADPRVIARILAHLGLPLEPPRPCPGAHAPLAAERRHLRQPRARVRRGAPPAPLSPAPPCAHRLAHGRDSALLAGLRAAYRSYRSTAARGPGPRAVVRYGTLCGNRQLMRVTRQPVSERAPTTSSRC